MLVEERLRNFKQYCEHTDYARGNGLSHYFDCIIKQNFLNIQYSSFRVCTDVLWNSELRNLWMVVDSSYTAKEGNSYMASVSTTITIYPYHISYRGYQFQNAFSVEMYVPSRHWNNLIWWNTYLDLLNRCNMLTKLRQSMTFFDSLTFCLFYRSDIKVKVKWKR